MKAFTCAGLLKAGFRDQNIGFSRERWQKSDNTHRKNNSLFPCALIIRLIHCPVCSLAMTWRDLTLSYQAVIPYFISL